MESTENTQSVETSEVQADNEQEIDYKAEYEKIVSEKERAAAMGTFESVLKEKGFDSEDKKIKDACAKLDNTTLQAVGSIIKLLTPQLKNFRTTPAAGTPTNIFNSKAKKPSFGDFIKK